MMLLPPTLRGYLWPSVRHPDQYLPEAFSRTLLEAARTSTEQQAQAIPGFAQDHFSHAVNTITSLSH
jgi:hypothetical protein